MSPTHAGLKALEKGLHELLASVETADDSLLPPADLQASLDKICADLGKLMSQALKLRNDHRVANDL
jgi:hypothetical protein